MKNVLFYISGHGYGHAVRTIEVVRALLKVRQDLRIIIRTSAPLWIFNSVASNSNVEISCANLDSGVFEDDPLHIDYEKTVIKLGEFLKKSLGVVYHETAYGMQNNVDLIVSDIPALAGEVAARLNVPCIAISNFLWDWIYEPMIIDEELRNSILLSVRTGYSKMSHWIRYPFGHDSAMLGKITDVSLVMKSDVCEAGVVKVELGLNIPSNKKVVYIAMRGGIDFGILSQAAKKAEDYVFLFAEETDFEFPKNVYKISPFPRFSFADLINSADVIIGKPGYGLASTCVGLKKPLLYPKRFGFREDDVLVPAIYNYIPAVEIPHEDFFSGNWNEYLNRLCGLPIPEQNISVDGAMESAEIISGYIG